MTNPTYSSDPADQSVDPRDVPAYDPSQGGPETLGHNETSGYAGSPTYTEPTAGNPYTAPTGDPYTTTTGDPYAVGGTGYSTDQPATGDQSTTDVAKGEAAAVKDTAVEAGKDVAATAKDEAV